MADEIINIPLPASDWPVIQAGLLELPGKFGIPVINRLAQALAEAQKPPEVIPLKGAKSNG